LDDPASRRDGDDPWDDRARRRGEDTGDDLSNGQEAARLAARVHALPDRIDMPRLVQLYLDGKLDLDTMVAERISLEDVNEAMAKLRTGDTVRSVIEFA
jgi:hypothetical protein